MRLLRTSDCHLLEFHPPSIPRYAILSHTWGEDEYIFSDRHDPSRRASAGFTKISRCCALAASEGYEYLWVDTCCIDKSSSAELTESINSMYRWYEKAQICYVYLADFSLIEAQEEGQGLSFPDSRWFTRGWTLQELLAPALVDFYDCDWIEIGSRSFLEQEISEICRIDRKHIQKPKDASVATKMSWASKRKTSREEDIAYSLLGLFGVHMPLIYGEGKNAFYRLQQEIIQTSTDESIFAWRAKDLSYSGLLARHPRAFEDSSDIEPFPLFSGINRAPYHMTNQGLSIEFNLYPLAADSVIMGALVHSKDPYDSGEEVWKKIWDNFSEGHFMTALNCHRRWHDQPLIIIIRMNKENVASRVDCQRLEFAYFSSDCIYKRSLKRTLLISQQYRLEDPWHFAGWSPAQFQSKLTFTPAAHNLFPYQDFTSHHEAHIEIGDDRSITVRHSPCPLDRPCAQLHFRNIQGYAFTIKWTKYGSSFGNLKEMVFHGAHELDRPHQSVLALQSSASFLQELPPETTAELCTTRNVIAPINKQLSLWIKSTWETLGRDTECLNVVVDVTTIDRLKALGKKDPSIQES